MLTCPLSTPPQPPQAGCAEARCMEMPIFVFQALGKKPRGSSRRAQTSPSMSMKGHENMVAKHPRTKFNLYLNSPMKP